MKLEELRDELRQDPEYVEAEEELRPIFAIADAIIALRIVRGWSQSELARRAGTRQANISRLEAGLTNPTVGFLRKIARAFDAELKVAFETQTEAAYHILPTYSERTAGRQLAVAEQEHPEYQEPNE